MGSACEQRREPLPQPREESFGRLRRRCRRRSGDDEVVERAAVVTAAEPDAPVRRRRVGHRRDLLFCPEHPQGSTPALDPHRVHGTGDDGRRDVGQLRPDAAGDAEDATGVRVIALTEADEPVVRWIPESEDQGKIVERGVGRRRRSE